LKKKKKNNQSQLFKNCNTCIIILIVETAAEVGCLQQIQAVPFRRDAKGH